MKQLKIEGILKKRFEKLNEAFDKIRLHANDDDIRVFRVKVKKLMAFLYLINAAKGHENAIKLPQKIARTYQLFGAIRTLQIQEDHLQKTLKGKKIAMPPIYAAYLTDHILHHRERIHEHLKGLQPFRKEEEKLMKALPGHISRKAIQQFIRTQGDAIEKLFTRAFPADKAFHEARLLLKNLLYLSPYLEVEISVLSPYHLLSGYEDINAFTIILGGFRDLCSAIDSLHATARIIKIDDNEKVILRTIESLWLKEKETFRKKIYDDLQVITASGRTVAAPVAWPVM